MKTKNDNSLDRRRAYTKIGLGIFFSFGLLIFMISVVIEKGFSQELTLVSILVIVMAIIFALQGVKQLRIVKKGLPLEDERTKKVLLIAGSKAFQYSMYYLLVLMWAINVFEILDIGIESLFGVEILGIGVIFGLCWLWANKQPDLDRCI